MFYGWHALLRATRGCLGGKKGRQKQAKPIKHGTITEITLIKSIWFAMVKFISK